MHKCIKKLYITKYCFISHTGDKFEGDLILTPDQLDAVMEQDSKRKNKFAAMKSKHWKTNGKTDVIKYYIESSLSK